MIIYSLLPGGLSVSWTPCNMLHILALEEPLMQPIPEQQLADKFEKMYESAINRINTEQDTKQKEEDERRGKQQE